MTKDEFYMGKALAEAKTAYAVGEIPIGAVIVYEKKVVARAYNLRESLPCATAHAELLAIEKACRALNRWRLTGCTLYVTVEPCPNHRTEVTAGVRAEECAALMKSFFRQRRKKSQRLLH